MREVQIERPKHVGLNDYPYHVDEYLEVSLLQLHSEYGTTILKSLGAPTEAVSDGCCYSRPLLIVSQRIALRKGLLPTSVGPSYRRGWASEPA